MHSRGVRVGTRTWGLRVRLPDVGDWGAQRARGVGSEQHSTGAGGSLVPDLSAALCSDAARDHTGPCLQIQVVGPKVQCEPVHQDTDNQQVARGEDSRR